MGRDFVFGLIQQICTIKQTEATIFCIAVVTWAYLWGISCAGGLSVVFYGIRTFHASRNFCWEKLQSLNIMLGIIN